MNMRTIHLCRVAAAIVAVSCQALVAAETYGVPSARRIPVADGVIQKGEYDGAMTFKGAADWRLAYVMHKDMNPPIDPRQTEFAITWSESSMFIAVRSATAPGGILKTVGKNDPLVMADSLEFWFNPPPAARNAEFARFGQFQLLVDSTGRTYARQHNPGYGLPARQWKIDGVKVANSIHGDLWDCEIEIPAAAFGAERLSPGDWGIVPGRNFRTGKSIQATYAPFRALGGYAVTAEYPVFRLVRGGNAVPFGGAPELMPQDVRVTVPGNVTVKVRAATPVPAKKYRRFFSTRCVPAGYFGVQQGATHEGRQDLLLFWHVNGKKEYKNLLNSKVPAPGEESVISVNVRESGFELYLDGERLGELAAPEPIDAAALGGLGLGGGTGDAEILSCRVSARTLTSEEIKADAQGDRALAGTLKWYPSETLLAAALSFPENTMRDGAPELRVADSDGKEVGRWSLPRKGTFVVTGKGKRRMVSVHDKIPLAGGARLKPGRYRAVLTAGNPRTEVMVKDFVSEDYPWFRTDIGRADILLPGFEPLVASGQEIRCVGRSYRFGGNGLPAEVWSLGRQILAAPVALTCERDGRKVDAFGGKTKFAFGKAGQTAVEYVGGNANLRVKGRVEQDGLIRLDLGFGELPAADRIYMDIPVKREFATLFHATGEGIRSNPAGFVPAGTGRVFGSRAIPQTHVDNFIPYCWVGTDDRGICYAADSDRGWRHCGERDAVELHRSENGDVTIRLNLINGASAGNAREITVCLQASPVKPMPKGWRSWMDTYVDVPCTRAMRNLASNPTWGCYIVGMARYPTFMDFDHVRKLAETIRTGKIDEEYKAKWIARCEEAMERSPEKVRWLAKKSPDEARKTLRAHVNAEFHYARMLYGKPNPVLYYYTCNADPCEGLYELEVLADEWGKYTAVYGSHQDYAVYYLDKMLEAGMGGVYNDNAFFRCNYDWVTGDAWIDDNGDVHPSFSLWALREHTRRQVVTMVQRGLDPWLTIHHTNANILPALGFATNTMGMEWKYGNSDYQDRYTPDYIRAVNQGLQGGFYPTSLEGIFEVKTPEERTRLTRTMFAALLTHEVRPTLQYSCDWRLYEKVMTKMMAFGIAKDDCTYTAYWNDLNPVVCSDKDVIVSVYSRGRRMLALCGSWADGDRNVVLSLKSGAIAAAKDAETDAPLKVKDGKAAITIPRHGFAIVELVR